MTSSTDPIVAMWLAGRLDPECERRIEQMAHAHDVQRLAVMPDVHVAGDVCNGCVIATTQVLYPTAVGGDIGCGMAAVRLNAEPTHGIDRELAAAILERWRKRVPIIRRRREEQAWCDAAPLPSQLSHPSLEKVCGRDGVAQLGTLGRGNHFLELQHDAEGSLWLMVHSGSRAMGQSIAAWHISRAARREKGPACLELGAGGEAYLADVAWACAYAAANRRELLRRAALALADVAGWSADESTAIDSVHNAVHREVHGGRELLVHRKGASQAFEGIAGLIPGSAGTFSVHVEGRGCEASLCSSSHGAGRVMSRTDARKQISVRRLRADMGRVWFAEDEASRLVEESPSAYRDLRVVMEAQRDLVRVTRRLTPLVSFKGV